MINEKRFYTVKELAQYFSVSRYTINNWMKSDRGGRSLPYILIGKRKRIFDIRDVDKWLEKLKEKGLIE